MNASGRPWLQSVSALDAAAPRKLRPTSCLCPDCTRPLCLPPAHAARGSLRPWRHRPPLSAPAVEQRSILPLFTSMHDAQAAVTGGCDRVVTLQHIQHLDLFLKYSDKTLATYVQNN